MASPGHSILVVSRGLAIHLCHCASQSRGGTVSHGCALNLHFVLQNVSAIIFAFYSTSSTLQPSPTTEICPQVPRIERISNSLLPVNMAEPALKDIHGPDGHVVRRKLIGCAPMNIGPEPL
ncbi:hypothetical protein B0T25DRAFT_176194 [Lasiosphaeria hispida]|uniref:Uncharacterized protein n=1 Tax=Lasiosphaeria hispida TaxID=260671 RepID=A0AAJ0HNB3_9PEZI|nr:hypothetical protein B0T25DRAFT_176194 [Lasiosphaeria hispida]